MDLTYALLDYQLRPKYQIHHTGIWNSQDKIARIMLWEDCRQEQDTLYLYDPADHADSLPPLPRSRILFLIRAQDWPSHCHEKGWSLLYTEETSTQAVNDILRAYTDFKTWTDQILLLSKVELDYPEMLRISSAYLKIDLMLIDKDYKVVSCHNYDPAVFSWQEAVLSDQMDTQEIQALYLDCPDFDETFSKNGLTYYPYAAQDRISVYYHNIDHQGRYLARLLIAIPLGQDTGEIFTFLRYLSGHLSSCYRRYYEQQLKKSRQEKIYTCLRELLSGRLTEKAPAVQAFRSIGWMPAHTYQILRLRSEGHMNSSQTLGYFCCQIEEHFPSIRALEMDGEISCIHDLSVDKDPDRFQADLPVFLRDHLFKAGVSNRFSDITDCYLYGQEAIDALLIGDQTDPDLWIYDFSAYSMRYILQKSTEDYPARELSHPAIRILEGYDASHPGAGLLDTLRQYFICGQNASKTADAMHIHRTTFLYRMKKIQQLTPLQIEDPDDILHLMLSFALS